MALLVFEHDPQETPARLGAILRDYGHRLRVIELHAGQAPPPDLDDVDGIVSMGGPMNVDEADQYPWMAQELALIRQAHEQRLPIVGVCLGAQLIAVALGGQVASMPQPELGWHEVTLAFPGTIDPVLAGVPWRSVQFHMHGQEVVKLPAGATPLAGSKACRNQAFKVGLTTYAFQYHFEWTRADLDRVLDANADWLREAGVDAEAIRQQVEEHYPLYRHLGDRLSHNIAQLLFSVNKRMSGRFGPGEPPWRQNRRTAHA
ncbi:MAG TPA: type 1 glutamine amidotransferase [Phycisphaeraceae bacterium]